MSNTPQSQPPDLISLFTSMNSALIDAGGILMPQALALDAEDKLTVMALDQSGPDITFLAGCLRRVFRSGPRELIYGFDRFTKPGQGTALDDVLTVSYWDGTGWHFGVMEYQHSPRRVMPINWQNAFWMAALAREASQVMQISEVRIRTSHPPTAYVPTTTKAEGR